jgi:pyruvate dehydrogenase E2 component (dihydrolipoamide acetyltransferase)
VRTLVVDEADLTRLGELRTGLKPEAEAHGVHLTWLPFIFRAVAGALAEFPAVNSSLDERSQEIVLKRYYHLGMAVTTDSGLVVPVIRDVPLKSLHGLAAEIAEVAERARKGKLGPSDFVGSTFTITSIGNVGTLFSFPIINVPDAAILGVHTIQRRAVVINEPEGEKIVARSMVYLSLSFDHRLIDGATASQFLRAVIRSLENPDGLILDA